MMPPSESSDQELIALLQKGNHPAFTELYNRYWEKLLLIAWNHTHDKIMAEDMVHELFISVWTKKYDFKVLNVTGFLATKLRFLIFKNYRKVQRRNNLARENMVFEEAVHEELEMEARFLKEYIDGVVDELPDKCRLVFKYSRELGLKNIEIAAAIGISEKGVEANLTRALKIIRKNIETAGIISPLVLSEVLKLIIH